MPLPYVYCFDVVHISLASWLNFTIHGCKKRNVLHENRRTKKKFLTKPKQIGCEKLNAVQERNGQQLGSKKNKKKERKRKKEKNFKSKKLVLWGVRKRRSISKIGYF